MKLKGKTIIELTDISTGKVTSHEDENFVTNALSDICQPVTSKHDALPTTRFAREGECSIEALMRGLLLFDKVLPEDPTRYFPEKGVKMVGHGSDNTYSGDDLTFGSYNSSQSDVSSPNERTYVWDFTSEQANGTINSVCLTTQDGGFIGYGSETQFEIPDNSRAFTNIIKAAISNEGSEDITRDKRVPVYLSFSGDYLLELDFTTLVTNTLKFYKTKLSTNEIDIFNRFHSFSSFESSDKHYSYIGDGFTETEEISLDITTLGSGTYFGMAQDGKYLYITQKQVSNENNKANAWAPGTALLLIRIDLETLSVSNYSVTNTTGVSLGIRVAYDTLSYGGCTFGVVDGYLFARSWESSTGAIMCKLYAINMNDNTDVRQVKDKNGGTNFVGLSSLNSAAPFSMTIQGKVAFSSTSASAYATSSTALLRCVDTTSFVLMTMATPLSSIRTQGQLSYSAASRPIPTDRPIYHVNGYRGSSAGTSHIFIGIVPNVLMTINNLSSPVEKTPAQTMRIIYKLTKAE